MNLTREQEAEVLENNKGLVVRFAKRFACRHGMNGSSAMMDDLVQDATIAFIEKLRAADTIEDALNFYRQALNEMTLDVMSYQNLSGPRRTSSMRAVIEKNPSTKPYEECENELIDCGINSIDNAVERVAFEDFVSQLPKKDRIFIEMAQSGASIKEIAAANDVSYDHVRYRMSRCRNKYLSECKG